MAVFGCWWCYSLVLVGATLVVRGVLVRIFTAGHPSGYTQGSSVRWRSRL